MSQAIKEHDVKTSDSLKRAHTYHNDLNDNIIKEVDDLSHRVDGIESVLDQLRGAKNLMIFAIGTNLLAVVAFLYTIINVNAV